MKAVLRSLIVSLVVFGSTVAVPAEDLKHKVKVEKLYEGLHPGLDPGLYVCAGDHLHVKGTVQNLGSVTLTSLKLEGRAYDAEGKLLGTAHPARINAPRLTPLKPGQKAEFNLEFLTITGPTIQLVKTQHITVVEANSAQ